MNERHTGKYRDVPMAPTEAAASSARFVEEGWGFPYRIGLIGDTVKSVATTESNSHSTVYVFQVRASDGSRFAVYADQYGNCGVCKGARAFEWLQARGIEAYVQVEDERV